MNTFTWEQHLLESKQAAISEAIKNGGRITPLLPAPEVAFSSNNYLASFSGILRSGDPFAIVYIMKALGSSMNDEYIIQNLLNEILVVAYLDPTLYPSQPLVTELLAAIWDESQSDSCAGIRIRTSLEGLNLPQEI